jgi:Asp-tRNA(Asn)/Glu-tRNA(Gln) amidotransferase B subunit
VFEGLLMKEFSGKADGKMISMILKKKLSEKD